MASFSVRAAETGYTPSIDSETSRLQSSEDTDIYLGAHAGALIFERSLNSVFGTSASSISSLGIKSAGVRVRIRDTLRGPFTVALSNIEIGKGKDFTRTYSQMTVGADTNYNANTYPWFDISGLFTTTNGNNTYLTPNNSKWYLYIKNGQKGNDYRMNRLSVTNDDVYRIYFETYEGTIQYYNGSSWQIVTPYYYNGTSWVQCTAQYYNGTSWVQC